MPKALGVALFVLAAVALAVGIFLGAAGVAGFP